MDGCGDLSAGRERVEHDEKEAGGRVDGVGFGEGTGFPVEGGRIGGGGADLDEEDLAVWVGGMEIDLVSLGCAEVMDLAAAAEEFDEHSGFEGVAGIGAAGAFVDRNEARVDRIGLAGIDHALAFRGGEKRRGADEEGILEVGEKSVQAVLRDG